MGNSSKQKGNRGERQVAALLQDRFPGKSFSRTVGSGNRWAQVEHLPSHATETLSGDLCCPEGFRWAVEVKVGYDLDLGTMALNPTLDKFIEQATDSARRAGKAPLIFYKKDRKPWVAMVESAQVPKFTHFNYSITYRDWLIVPVESLFGLPDNFWFSRF